MELLDVVWHRYKWCKLCVFDVDGRRRFSVYDACCVFLSNRTIGAVSVTCHHLTRHGCFIKLGKSVAYVVVVAVASR